jgi:hypothetical protein
LSYNFEMSYNSGTFPVSRVDLSDVYALTSSLL